MWAIAHLWWCHKQYVRKGITHCKPKFGSLIKCGALVSALWFIFRRYYKMKIWALDSVLRPTPVNTFNFNKIVFKYIKNFMCQKYCAIFRVHFPIIYVFETIQTHRCYIDRFRTLKKKEFIAAENFTLFCVGPIQWSNGFNQRHL